MGRINRRIAGRFASPRAGGSSRRDVGEEAALVAGAGGGGVAHAEAGGGGDGVEGVADDAVGAHAQRGEPAAAAQDAVEPPAAPRGEHGDVLLAAGGGAADAAQRRLEGAPGEDAQPGHGDDGAPRVDCEDHAAARGAVEGRRPAQVAECYRQGVYCVPYQPV